MKKSILLVALLLVPSIASGQAILKTKTLTTSGATCSIEADTNCIILTNLLFIPSVSAEISITGTATLQFEYSVNGTTWRSMPDDVTAATSTTANGAFFFSNPGYFKVRVRASAISGTVDVNLIQGFTGLRSTATLTGGGGDGAILDGVSSAIKATVFNLTNSKALSTQIVDTNGTAITSFGGGTQYTTGAATVASPIGTMPVFDNGGTIAKVSAAAGLPTTLVGTNNFNNISGTITLPTGAATSAKQPALGTAGSAATDVLTIQGIASMIPILATLSGTNNINTVSTVTAVTSITNPLPTGSNVIGHIIADSGSTTVVSGNVTVIQPTGTNLHTVCDSGCSSSIAPADNSAFTAGSTSTSPVAGFYHATRDAVTDGRLANFAINAKRGLFVTPEDASSNSLFGTATALANTTANPTLGGIATFNMCFNGTTWDRCSTSTVSSGAVDANTTRTVAATDSPEVTTLGATGDAAATAGSTGSLSAKLRLITTQLNNQACADISSVSSVVISGTANAQLVAISGSTVVYVCGFNVTSAADVNFKLISGTGSVCATGSTNRTGLYQLTAASGAGLRGVNTGFGALVTKSASGEALCFSVSAAVQVDGVLTYVQR